MTIANLTMTFPEGLTSQQYAAIREIAEGHPTAREDELRARLERCMYALDHVAMHAVDMTPKQVVELRKAGPDGEPAFHDLASAIVERVEQAKPAQYDGAAPRFFNVNPVDMTDGSGRLYSIDTSEGERVASTTSEAAARELRDALNDTLKAWAAKTGSDAVVNAD